MTILLRRTLCAITLSLMLPLARSQAPVDKDTVLAQAQSLAHTDGKIAAANYLEQHYAQIASVEDSIAVLNQALQYYYVMNAQQSLRSLAERSLTNIDKENERIWQTHSQAYGQLARYHVEVENNNDAALPLLLICGNGIHSNLRTWCEHTRKTIIKERKLQYRNSVNERIVGNATSYWAILLIVLLSISIFAYRLLRNPAAQKH